MLSYSFIQILNTKNKFMFQQMYTQLKYLLLYQIKVNWWNLAILALYQNQLRSGIAIGKKNVFLPNLISFLSILCIFRRPKKKKAGPNVLEFTILWIRPRFILLRTTTKNKNKTPICENNLFIISVYSYFNNFSYRLDWIYIFLSAQKCIIFCWPNRK